MKSLAWAFTSLIIILAQDLICAPTAFGFAPAPPISSAPSSSSKSGSSSGTPNELLDYLVQDVCVDAGNRPIAGDPYSCASHRNLQVGEDSPYMVTDFDRNHSGTTYEAMMSFPVMGEDGSIKVMAAKNLQGNFNSSFRFSFEPSRDGFDLIDTTHSNYASFVRTSDGGCYDQIWSRDGSDASMADRAGGWILFPYAGAPSSWATSNSTTNATYHIQLTQGLSNCSNGHSTGVSYWNAPAKYVFETGKVITAIRSDHFAGTNLSQSNNALERYYFTKLYGFTRWEAWIPQSRCFSDHGNSNPLCHPESANYPLVGRCSVMNVSSTGNPAIDTWGGQKWVRVDCRDETNYIALSQPQLMLDNTMAQENGFVDINYSAR